jgi:hypothetical protein
MMDDIHNASLISYETARTAYEETLVQKYKNSLSYENLDDDDDDDDVKEPFPARMDSSLLDGRQSVLRNYSEVENIASTPQSNDDSVHQRETPDDQFEDEDDFDYEDDFEPDASDSVPMEVKIKKTPKSVETKKSCQLGTDNLKTVRSTVSSKTSKLLSNSRGSGNRKVRPPLVISNTIIRSGQKLSNHRASGPVGSLKGVSSKKSQSPVNRNMPLGKSQSRDVQEKNPDARVHDPEVFHSSGNQKRASLGGHGNQVVRNQYDNRMAPAGSHNNNPGQVKERSQRRSSLGEGQGCGGSTRKKSNYSGTSVDSEMNVMTKDIVSRRSSQSDGRADTAGKVMSSSRVTTPKETSKVQSSKSGAQRPGVQASKNNITPYQGSPTLKQMPSKHTSPDQNMASKRSDGRNKRLESLGKDPRRMSMGQKREITNRKKTGGNSDLQKKSASSLARRDGDRKQGRPRRTEDVRAKRSSVDRLEKREHPSSSSNSSAVKRSPDYDVLSTQSIAELLDISPHPPRRGGTPITWNRAQKAESTISGVSHDCDDDGSVAMSVSVSGWIRMLISLLKMSCSQLSPSYFSVSLLPLLYHYLIHNYFTFRFFC